MASHPVPAVDERRHEPGRAVGVMAALRNLGGTAIWVLAVSALAGSLGWLFAEVLSVSPRLLAPLAAALGAVLVVAPLALLQVKLARDIERGRRELASVGSRDGLTGAANRPHFIGLAEREFARSRRYGHGAALLLVDIDRFRRVSEGRDPTAGDAVLRELARHTLQTLRGADALARFGNAQLAVFLAQADPLGALDAAERIRERIEQLEVPWRDQALRVTVSVGVAVLRPAHQNLQAVIDDAEAALGAARHAGGNCVRAAPVDPTRSQAYGPSVGDNQAAGPL